MLASVAIFGESANSYPHFITMHWHFANDFWPNAKSTYQGSFNFHNMQFLSKDQGTKSYRETNASTALD